MIRLASFLLPVTLMTLSGCAGSKGFDRAEMLDVMRQTVNLSGPQTAAGVTEPASTISAPFRLGLLFAQKEFPPREAIRLVDWLSQDRDLLIHALAPLRDQHILNDMIVIANPAMQNPGLPEIRKAAARYGADMIVIVTGTGAVNRYNNGYALLYPTIIGAYLAPGTVSEGLFLIEGSLWDVRSGTGYGIQGAEGTATKTGPATALEDREVLAEAKAAAVRNFGKRLAELIGHAAKTGKESR
jgi:rhombotail lipoprotein